MQRRDAGPLPPDEAQGEFIGPEGQFKWYRILFSILMAIWHSGRGTAVGLGYMVWHHQEFFGGLLYCVQHPKETLQGIMDRMNDSLQKNGVVYTIVCAICMVVLPGGGLFGKAVSLSEHGRKAEAMSKKREEELQSVPVPSGSEALTDSAARKRL